MSAGIALIICSFVATLAFSGLVTFCSADPALDG